MQPVRAVVEIDAHLRPPASTGSPPTQFDPATAGRTCWTRTRWRRPGDLHLFAGWADIRRPDRIEECGRLDLRAEGEADNAGLRSMQLRQALLQSVPGLIHSVSSRRRAMPARRSRVVVRIGEGARSGCRG
jgi:hypothetical protein